MNSNSLSFKFCIRLSVLFFVAQVCSLTGCTDHKESDTKEASDWALKTLADLTIEKKVAQLICVDISGSYIPEDDPRF